MIKPEDARKLALMNVPFEKKVEIYNDVDKRVQEAALKGERKVTLSEAEYFAIGSELEEKGYKRNPVHDILGGPFTIKIDNNISYASGGFVGSVSRSIESISGIYNYYF